MDLEIANLVGAYGLEPAVLMSTGRLGRTGFESRGRESIVMPANFCEPCMQRKSITVVGDVKPAGTAMTAGG